jgi:hypothetical protein
LNYVNLQVNFSNYFLILLLKKIMVAKTPDQLAKLALAREKALEIRKANAEVNRREKELKKLEKDERAKRVNDNYEKMKNPKPQEVKEPVILQEEEYDSEPEPEVVQPVVVKQKAKPKPIKKKKKVVIVQQEEISSEEEEEEIVYVTRPPKEKKTKKIYAYRDEEPPAQREPPIRYSALGSDRAALVHRMFSLT